MTNNVEPDTVEIPSNVWNRIKSQVADTEFEGVSTYATHVLREVLYQANENDESGQDDEETVDEAQVEERLKSLGYLNE